MTRREWTDAGGYLHREDGPALIETDEDGLLLRLSWWLEGEPLRLGGGPTEIRVHWSGGIEWRYPDRGDPHREHGPAVLIAPDGLQVTHEEWIFHTQVTCRTRVELQARGLVPFYDEKRWRRLLSMGVDPYAGADSVSMDTLALSIDESGEPPPAVVWAEYESP